MDVAFSTALKEAVERVMAGSDGWQQRLADDPQSLGGEVAAQLGDAAAQLAFRAALQADLEAHGVALLPGVFAIGDELPDTPQVFVPLPSHATTQAMQLAVLGANAALGKATVSYGSENGGALFVNLVTMPGVGRLADKSKKNMRGHTDAMSFPFPGEVDPVDGRIAPSPDLVCLAALRNPEEVPTTVMPLSLILKLLPATDVAELKKRQYVLLAQQTFAEGTREALGDIHSVGAASVLLGNEEGGTWVRFSHGKISPPPDAKAAHEAVEHFKEAASHSVRDIPLAPGDLLLVDNRRALHGRGRVGDLIGGQSRWLVRTYALAAEHALGRFHPGSAYKLWP